jgi:P27 family predicted phage terminase small subunit
MKAVEGTGSIVDEPAWALLLTDELEIDSAKQHWRRVTTEMRERDILSPTNLHAIQRLVLSYVIYDRCSREVAETGAVAKPKRGNPKSIARLSPYFTAMREAGNDAERSEADLGITPRRRSTVTKVSRSTRKATGADTYLRPVAK